MRTLTGTLSTFTLSYLQITYNVDQLQTFEARDFQWIVMGVLVLVDHLQWVDVFHQALVGCAIKCAAVADNVQVHQ